MKNYVMLVNAENCNQCYACALACKDEHFGNDHLPITYGIQELQESWLDLHIEERGSGSQVRAVCWPELCRHCEDPSCVKAAGDKVYQREDGIVIIDPAKTQGAKDLLTTCPFNAIVWNGEKNLPQKCTFCAHLLDAGEPVPRCVEACPNGTLVFGDANDPASEVARLLQEYPELAKQTGAVRYYNMPGRFIAGSVYLNEAEAAVGAEVKLSQNGKVIAACETNGFGDFKIKNLPEKQQFTLTIGYQGFAPFTADINTGNDVCWEEILLETA